MSQPTVAKRGRFGDRMASGCLLGLQVLALVGALAALPGLVGVRLLLPSLLKATEGADAAWSCQVMLLYAVALGGLGIFLVACLLLFVVCFIGWRFLRHWPPAPAP